MAKLTGKVAIVTGASKGIGAQIAKELALEGASIVVNYSSSKEGADKVVNEIVKAGGKAVAVQANLSDPRDVTKLFDETIKIYKKLDILINNAGVYEFIAVEDITPESFHKMFNLNVLGLILASREAAKYFEEAGGSIVNIGSVAGAKGIAKGTIYCATKGAVDAVTRCLAQELGPRNIRVNSINPGMVETEGASEFVNSEFGKYEKSHTPLGRIGQTTDIAPAVTFIVSDGAAFITGETLYISGGNR